MISVSKEDGHLLVAGVRVLAALNQSPPDAEQLAELLKMPPEAVRLKCAALIELGILKQIESAWKAQLQVGRHLDLETLTPSADQPRMDAELADFDKRKREEAQRMDRMFSDGTLARERQQKMDDMEKGLFGSKPSKPDNPFDD